MKTYFNFVTEKYKASLRNSIVVKLGKSPQQGGGVMNFRVHFPFSYLELKTGEFKFFLGGDMFSIYSQILQMGGGGVFPKFLFSELQEGGPKT